jgi:hypothetical protein
VIGDLGELTRHCIVLNREERLFPIGKQRFGTIFNTHFLQLRDKAINGSGLKRNSHSDRFHLTHSSAGVASELHINGHVPHRICAVKVETNTTIGMFRIERANLKIPENRRYEKENLSIHRLFQRRFGDSCKCLHNQKNGRLSM